MAKCDVVLAAVRQNGSALEHAAAELKADRNFMLPAVQQSGSALRYAVAELQADRSVLLAAVQHSGLALWPAIRQGMGHVRSVYDGVLRGSQACSQGW